jgi:hypothetical protein
MKTHPPASLLIPKPRPLDHRLTRAFSLGLALIALMGTSLVILAAEASMPPRVVPLDFAMGENGDGSVITADLDGDNERDFVITAPGRIAAYRQNGQALWLLEADVRVSAGSSESRGLPGHHAPGVQVADIDGNGQPRLLYLDQSSTVHIHDAATGKQLRSVRVPHPEGAERWEHLVVANLRGLGDRDVVLQATNAKGYRVGRYVAAYAIETLPGPPLWQNHHFGALAHGPLRVADLNLDGRDEICGFTLLGPDGQPTTWKYPPIHPEFGKGRSFHIDALIIEDVRPEIPGLEVVLLEEGRNYVGLAHFERGLLWWETLRQEEPQNAAVGEFDTQRPGLEIWNRSRHNRNQVPWVFDASGQVIAEYPLSQVAPEGWTDAGIEVIVPIHWTGAPEQLMAAKERHTSGHVAVIEPLTGRFVLRWKEKADRLYVADVSGDWREEIIVIQGRELRIYENPAPNPRPDQPRLWDQPHYRRNKMSWNYYSP